MALSVGDCLGAIESHTRGLATAAEGHFEARIEHCPEWSMSDLVWHLAQVHWFWNQVALHRPTEAPEELVRPERPADGDLLATLLANMTAMVDTLRAADQSAPCWTWGLEENVGFITRHQVQEAAVHHWDAVNAVGSGPWEMDPVVAADAVEEFLTHSVANRRWPRPDVAPLGTPLEIPMPGQLVTVMDGPDTGTLTHAVTASDRPGNAASSVLLWLYGRLPEDRIAADPPDALARLRALSSTD